MIRGRFVLVRTKGKLGNGVSEHSSREYVLREM